MPKARVLYWFRTDLRLHDSPALRAALDVSGIESFIPFWCWDPEYIFKHRAGINRFRFLLESMEDVSSGLSKLNPKSKLFVARGEPQELLPELLRRWRITHLAFETDPTGYARRRDEGVRKAAKSAGVEVVERAGRHLYDIHEIVKRKGSPPVMSMTSLQSVVSKMGEPAKPLAAPDSLPDPVPPCGAAKDLAGVIDGLRKELDGLPHYSSKPGLPDVDYNSGELGGQRTERVTCYDTLLGPDDAAEKKKAQQERDVALFSVPTLSSLGVDLKAAGASEKSVVPGGETEGLRRLGELCKDAEYVATFAKPKTSPCQDTLEPSTTLLSPYLKFGCVSVRRVWWDAREAAKRYRGPKTGIPESLEGQLLFRDMYAAGELAVGDAYAGVRGNSVCRYMDWYLPTVYDDEGRRVEPRPRGDDVSEARLEAFRSGTTGFPWIDALVRQLRLTGWIHHLGRHSLAAFLTRGQCWISWERGADFFEEMLLDADYASNPGNWMWLSCSAYFAQFFRVYGLVSFPTKYDKTGKLVRKYCPELKDFPDKFIYAPHTAPIEVQRKAKCIIGEDYPFPILDEKEEKQKCLDRCKAAYAAKLYGNSKEVLSGKAEAMLRKKHGIPDPKPPAKPQGSANKIPEWAKAGLKSEKASQAVAKSEPASAKKKGEAKRGAAAKREKTEDSDDDEMPAERTDIGDEDDVDEEEEDDDDDGDDDDDDGDYRDAKVEAGARGAKKPSKPKRKAASEAEGVTKARKAAAGADEGSRRSKRSKK